MRTGMRMRREELGCKSIESLSLLFSCVLHFGRHACIDHKVLLLFSASSVTEEVSSLFLTTVLQPPLRVDSHVFTDV